MQGSAARSKVGRALPQLQAVNALSALLQGFLLLCPMNNTPHFYKASWHDLRAPPNSRSAWLNHLPPAMNEGDVILLLHRAEGGTGIPGQGQWQPHATGTRSSHALSCQNAEDWKYSPVQPAQLSGPASRWGIFPSAVSPPTTSGHELGSFHPPT